MNSIFLKLSLTLVCISSTLSFCSSRERVTMRNSPPRSSQLRSPSAPSRSDFSQLLLKHQIASAALQAQPLISATPLNRENLEKLIKAIAPIQKKITEFKNGTTPYTTADLKKLQTQLGVIDLSLLNIDTSAVSEKQQWNEASTATTLCLVDIRKLQSKLIPYFPLPPLKRSKSQSHKQKSVAAPAPTIIPVARPVPEIQHPRYQRPVQQATQQVPIPVISDAFRGTSSNQVDLSAQGSFQQSPMPRDIHKPLAEIIPDTISDAFSSTSSNQVDLSAQGSFQQSPMPRDIHKIIPDTPVTTPAPAVASPVAPAQRYQPLPAHPKPSFMKRNWKLATICTLALASGLVGGEIKYKLLTRLGTRLFHGATITGQAIKIAQPSWLTKSMNWIVTLLWRRS